MIEKMLKDWYSERIRWTTLCRFMKWSCEIKSIKDLKLEWLSEIEIFEEITWIEFNKYTNATTELEKNINNHMKHRMIDQKSQKNYCTGLFSDYKNFILTRFEASKSLIDSSIVNKADDLICWFLNFIEHFVMDLPSNKEYIDYSLLVKSDITTILGNEKLEKIPEF